MAQLSCGWERVDSGLTQIQDVIAPISGRIVDPRTPQGHLCHEVQKMLPQTFPWKADRTPPRPNRKEILLLGKCHAHQACLVGFVCMALLTMAGLGQELSTMSENLAARSGDRSPKSQETPTHPRNQPYLWSHSRQQYQLLYPLP